MSDAETLREAARLMRERAENSAVGSFGPLTFTANGFSEKNGMTWAHYRSMTPAVALAVADWLDSAADDAPPDPHEPGETNALGLPCADCARFYRARVVAVAYLGGDA